MSADFKKIRSVISRKEVWEKAATLSDHHALVRLGGDQTYLCTVGVFEKEGVWLKFDVNQMTKDLFYQLTRSFPVEMIGYLSVSTDRYYFLGNLKSEADVRVLVDGCQIFVPYQFDMYKLDRRSNFRVKLELNDQIPLKIEAIDGVKKEVFAKVTDISGGGFRAQIPQQEGQIAIKADTILSGEIKPSRDKVITFEGLVKHCTHSNSYYECGVMVFDDQTKSLNRLMALTLIWQKKILSSVTK